MATETKAAKPAKAGKAGKLDIRAWAASIRNDTRCTLCKAPPEVLEAISIVSNMRVDRETEVSQGQLREMVREQFGVDISRFVMRMHIATCLKIDWLNRTRKS